MKRVTIIGGGLAGLIAAIELERAGIHCLLVEKKQYPFHRVCGEYISNEVVSFLRSRQLYPADFRPPQIKDFHLSSIDGKFKSMPLDLGGFGISRYTFDNLLFQHAAKLGVEFYLKEEVISVIFNNEKFQLKTHSKEWESEIVIGSFGKRSKVDHQLNRTFIQKRSLYLGVKYHVRTSHADEVIALHNFPGGYCGISNIEEAKSTVCYLSRSANLKRFKTIREMEERVLFRNPIIKSIFSSSDFLFEKPEVIHEISFETKLPVENHILMAGDAAGMIAPLCGNGMAIAIQSARLLSAEVIRFLARAITRDQMEHAYASAWNSHFRARLFRGRYIQRLFGNEFASRIAVSMVMNMKPFARQIIRSTHGEPF